MKQIWQRLSKRERTLVALTLLIALVVVGRYFLVSPLLQRREWVKGQLEIQPRLLDRNLRYIGQKAEIMTALEKARSELKALEPSLLSGDTPSVSASDLQQTVQSLAAKEGTQVISTRVLNPEALDTFTKISIQVEVSGQVDQLANLIKGIESTEKLLVVNELNIRSLFAPTVARPQLQPVPQVAAQNLRTSLTVSGFVRSKPAMAPGGEPTPGQAKMPARNRPGP